MTKKKKTIILILIVLVSIFIFKNKIFGKPTSRVHQLVQEDYMSLDTFTLSPDNQWILYSNGKSKEEDLIAINIDTLKKYNLTTADNLDNFNTMVFMSGLNSVRACWSPDSKYCSVGDYYIDFTDKEPRLLSFTPLTPQKKLIQETPRTCSDCNNEIQERSDRSTGRSCGSFTILSPDLEYTAKKYSCDMSGLKRLYIINNKGQEYKIANQINYFHWSSDSKRLYFTEPKNIISYINVE